MSVTALCGAWLWALPALAQEGGAMAMEAEEAMAVVHELGPTVGHRMLHAWVALGAAVAIFLLTLRFMRGGKLAQPIFLIGLGALADAVLGLSQSAAVHVKYMWLGSLMFSFSVVVGVVWIGAIFGVFQVPRRPTSSSQPNQPPAA